MATVDKSFKVKNSLEVGSSPFVVNSTGRVGIGTSSPDGALHVKLPTTPSGLETHVDFILENTGPGNTRFFLKTLANNRNWEFFADDNDGGFGIYDGIAQKRRMSILPNGKVGFNVGVPTVRLDVGGSTRTYGLNSLPLTTPGAITSVVSATGGTLAANTYFFRVVAIDNLGGTTLPGTETAGIVTTGSTSKINLSWTPINGADGYRVYFGNTSGGQNAYFITSDNSFEFTTTTGSTAGTVPTSNNSGYVTIGGSPAGLFPLTVFSSSFVQIQANNGTVSQAVGYASGVLGYSGTLSNHSYALLTNNAERVRVDTSGRVGIGTGSPSEILHIQSPSGNTTVRLSGATSGVSTNIDLTSAVFASINATVAPLGITSNESIRLSVAGTERMRITSAGFVGIGVTPFFKLDVYDASSSIIRTVGDSVVQNQLVRYSSDSSAPILILQKLRGSTTAALSVTSGDSIGDILMQAFDGTSVRNAAMIKSAISGTVSTGVTPATLEFYTQNASGTLTENMRISPVGNVGIGTNNPSTKLEVSGGDILLLKSSGIPELTVRSSQASGYTPPFIAMSRRGVSGGITPDSVTIGELRYDFLNTSSGYSAAGIISVGIGANGASGAPSFMVFNTHSGSALSERMRITSNGNIGIGNSSPSGKLHLGNGTDLAYFLQDGTGTFVGHSIRNRQTTASANSISFIDSINESNIPDSHIFFSHEIDGSSNMVFSTTPSGVKTSDRRVERIRIIGNGNVGIGTFAPSERLDVVGAIKVSGVTSTNQTAAGTFDYFSTNNASRILSWGPASTNGAVEIWTGQGAATADRRVAFSATSITAYVPIIAPASTTSSAPLRVPHGTAPSAPVNGDIWTQTDGLYARINGSTFGPIGGGTSNLPTQSGNAGRFLSTDGTTPAWNAQIFYSGTNIGIGLSNPAYKLEVNGSFAATTKSFVIDHPTKPDMKLRYGSLEGPENGVYVRGKSSENIIELPDYWTGLVDEDTITVQLTAKGKHQALFVEDIADNKIYVGGVEGEFFYFIQAERKDVDKLVVEF